MKKPHLHKLDVIREIASRAGVRGDIVETVLEGFLTIIVESLVSGKEVKVTRFGTFNLKKRKARLYHDVKTQSMQVAPDRYVPTFTFHPNLKKTITDAAKRNPWM